MAALPGPDRNLTLDVHEHVPTSTYRERRPPVALTDRVACFWYQRIGSGVEDYRQPVIPDGCVDIVWVGNEHAIVAGPSTKHVQVTIPPDTTLLGVRFRPGWAAKCLGLPMEELLNTSVSLDSIWPDRYDALVKRPSEFTRVDEQIRSIEGMLVGHLFDTESPGVRIQESMSWLLRNPSERVRDLARELGCSERQLTRIFCANVGYGPKMFQRIGRVQKLRAASERMSGPAYSLAEIAHRLGYTDQAHMNHDVRILANTTPGALLSSGRGLYSMSDLYKTIV